MTMMLEMIVCCFHITSFIELLPQWMWIIQNWHDCCWWIGWAVLTIAVSIVTICFVVSYTLQLTFSFMSCTFHKKLFNYQPAVVSKSPPQAKMDLGLILCNYIFFNDSIQYLTKTWQQNMSIKMMKDFLPNVLLKVMFVLCFLLVVFVFEAISPW